LAAFSPWGGVGVSRRHGTHPLLITSPSPHHHHSRPAAAAPVMQVEWGRGGVDPTCHKLSTAVHIPATVSLGPHVVQGVGPPIPWPQNAQRVRAGKENAPTPAAPGGAVAAMAAAAVASAGLTAWQHRRSAAALPPPQKQQQQQQQQVHQFKSRSFYDRAALSPTLHPLPSPEAHVRYQAADSLLGAGHSRGGAVGQKRPLVCLSR
jgi:hypothetical protein